MITLLIVGSRLYGLTNELSDTDYLAIISDGESYPFPENKDIEELKTVVESFPASTKPDSSQNNNGQNTNGQKFNLSTAQDLYSYVSDITVN